MSRRYELKFGTDYANPANRPPMPWNASTGLDKFNQSVTAALQQGAALVGDPKVVSNGDMISFYQGVQYGAR
jgi:hypothetical protein